MTHGFTEYLQARVVRSLRKSRLIIKNSTRNRLFGPAKAACTTAAAFYDSHELYRKRNLELKRSTSEVKEAVISISSILNKHGKGTLYFGIADDGSVVGQQIGKSTLKDISKSISDHLEPKIYPHMKIVKISGKNFLPGLRGT